MTDLDKERIDQILRVDVQSLLKTIQSLEQKLSEPSTNGENLIGVFTLSFTFIFSK
jgi:hypothetical protein